MKFKRRKKIVRRDLLKAAVGGFIAWHSPAILKATELQLEPNAVKARPKLVWVVLRGAMDSLHAILPLSDPDLMVHRKRLVTPVKDRAFNLGNGFALHPALKDFNYLYKKGQLIPVVATESGAKTRSHFQAQDILESGLPKVDTESGWLNRAVEVYRGESLAVAHTLPVGLRGRQLAKTWYPDLLEPASDDLYERLENLYKDDELLSERLHEGLRNRQLLSGVKAVDSKYRYNFSSLTASCGTLLASRDGPDCAMLEMNGWDTHQNQAGRLDRQFSTLDKGIEILRKNLADQWDNTVVIMTTEFGRTVAENGTRGTDHGTASAMFVAGGAVAGGMVKGRWPGLAKSNLFEGRDLMPTSDTRQWIRAILSQHWRLNSAQLDYVFPTIKTMDTPLIRPLPKSDSVV
jgi:uncharacterized protein (DUF1501 family)